ncbi:hypothetical protein NMG60_11019524 [Bertholletia excelsa]
MEEKKDDEGIRSPNRTVKRRSCKGYLYYSSIRKSKSQNPMCVGLSRTLDQVPSYVVEEPESEASKEDHILTDFKYACIGYSVHLERGDPSTDLPNKHAEMPLCVGIELLLDKRPSNANPTPAHVHKREDGHSFPQPRTYKPAHSPWDEFLNRFARSANVVASGVARNVHKVGNHIKSTLDDILYRRPK